MKLRKTITAITFIFITFSFVACNSGGNNNQNNSDTTKVKTTIEKTDETSENQSETVEDDYDYTAKYICPMHCKDSGNEEAGTCPKCKMDLIENLDYKE